MYKLHLTDLPVEVVKNGSTIILTEPLYNVNDENFLKENGFFKCCKCKEYFDVANNFGEFHPRKDDKDYCDCCFAKVDAQFT